CGPGSLGPNAALQSRERCCDLCGGIGVGALVCGLGSPLELPDALENAGGISTAGQRSLPLCRVLAVTDLGSGGAQAFGLQCRHRTKEACGERRILGKLALENGYAESDDGACLECAHGGRNRLAVEPGDLADDLAGTQLTYFQPARRIAVDIGFKEAVGDEEDGLGLVVPAHQNPVERDRAELGRGQHPVNVLRPKLLKYIERNIAHLGLPPALGNAMLSLPKPLH